LRDPTKLTKKNRQKLVKPPTYCTYCFNNACTKQKVERMAGNRAALMVSGGGVARARVQEVTLNKPTDNVNGPWNTHIAHDAFGCAL